MSLRRYSLAGVRAIAQFMCPFLCRARGHFLKKNALESRDFGVRQLWNRYKPEGRWYRGLYTFSAGNLPTISPAATVWPASTMAWLPMRAPAPMIVGTSVTLSYPCCAWVCE